MEYTIDNRAEQLRRYIQRGWALVPLHDVSGGACSCRQGAACRSAGKHPRPEEWQRPENLVRDEGGLAAALARWPSSNWGLATGLISGVWALDYDPKSVKAGEEHRVAAVLEACWASATWVQRTGSGGLHFVFALPEDFVPNNGPGTLPAGFDVRGARRGESGGGQIVIAPSVSGVGAYEVQADRPPSGAPGIVLEAVRPAPPRVRDALPHISMAAEPGQIGSYVTSAINGELAALRSTWERRNQRAWTAAARCVEMINTGAAGAEAVYASWWAAAQAHPDRAVTVPDAELLRVWASAERHVGDRPADLSGVGGPRGWGGDAIHPLPAPSAPDPGTWSVPVGGAAQGANGYPQGVHGAVGIDDSRRDNRDGGVTSQLSAMDDPVTAMIARMLTPEQLQARPNPVPLINGMLDMASCAWLIGAPGSFKSFVALDFAAHVGLGMDWHGHKVTQGLVIYVIAEGDTGMKLREAAWNREYQPLKDVLFLAEPVQADERRMQGQWTVLVEACRRLKPVLVIIDTQARVTIGLKENDNSDMSYYAEQADRIKRATGACVLTVHHTGRQGDDARGASSIDGAQDAELKVQRAGKSLSFKLVTDKQKDQAEAEAMQLTMRSSGGGSDPETGRDLSSLVIDGSGLTAPVLAECEGPREPEGRVRTRQLYQLIRDTVNHGEGGSRDKLKGLLGAQLTAGGGRPNTVSQQTGRAWNDLIALGLIIKRDREALFKVLVLGDQGPDGVLTPNADVQATDAPEGWSVVWPDAEAAERHSKTMMMKAASR